MIESLANRKTPGAKLNTFKASKRKVSQAELELNITGLSEQGQGIAKHRGKVIFVRGAIVGERVRATLLSSHKDYDQAVCKRVLEPSAARVQARCEHYNHCGGCQLQHVDYRSQLLFKSELAAGKLTRLLAGSESAVIVAEPISSEPFAYRHRARLSVSASKHGCSFGFKKRGSHTIEPIDRCDVLLPALAAVIPTLQKLVSGLRQRSQIQQLLLLEDSSGIIFVRIIGNRILPEEDVAALASCSSATAIELEYYDSGCNSSRWRSSTTTPYYKNHTLELSYQYMIDDFTQVNPRVNEAMINQAISWLNLSADDRVADFFCGIGNISLAMAGFVASLQGYELVPSMVDKAQINAIDNNIDNCLFEIADLFSADNVVGAGLTKVVLDPPRAGAESLCRQLAQWPLESILYISCNGATLFRDAQVLLAGGFTVEKFGLVDMFPQTEHVEMMALFQRPAVG